MRNVLIYRYIIIGILAFSNLFLQPVFSQYDRNGIPALVKYNFSLQSDVFELHTSIASTAAYALQSNKLNPTDNFSTSSVNIHLKNSGRWVKLFDNLSVWSVRIKHKEAFGMSFILRKCKLKQGEKLYFYSESELLGGFTDADNNTSLILSTLPVEGNDIRVEFDTPYGENACGYFQIESITSLLKNTYFQDPDTCNININCSLGADWQREKRAVCKIYISGKACTGTLLNNTALDMTPYVLTANHCLWENTMASTSVFTFDFESPSCNAISAIERYTITGATVVASQYDLDMTLLKLNQHPLLAFKPYYAGWSTATGTNLNKKACIHHPWGGIKKIAIDNDPPVSASFVSDGDTYKTNAFWMVERWDTGVTEYGSSGGALFDAQHRVIGTLTGGKADCVNPVEDYFAKFSESYTSTIEPTASFKRWLDPLSTNTRFIDGLDPLPAPEISCDTVSNILETEQKGAVAIANGTGYYSGNNSESFTAFAEEFYASDNQYVSGVFFNVFKTNRKGFVKIDIRQSDLGSSPLFETLVPLNKLYALSHNYIEFFPPISLTGKYYVTWQLNNAVSDTLVINQSLPVSGRINTAWIKLNQQWVAFSDAYTYNMGASFDIQPVVCFDTPDSFTQPVPQNKVNLFPNPAHSFTQVQGALTNQQLTIDVYNVNGQRINVKYSRSNQTYLLNLSTLQAGIYIVKVSDKKEIYRAILLKN